MLIDMIWPSLFSFLVGANLPKNVPFLYRPQERDVSQIQYNLQCNTYLINFYERKKALK